MNSGIGFIKVLNLFKFSNWRYDFIIWKSIFDIGRPEMDGIESTREALAINHGSVHYFNIIKAGAKDFVLKIPTFKNLK